MVLIGGGVVTSLLTLLRDGPHLDQRLLAAPRRRPEGDLADVTPSALIDGERRRHRLRRT